MKRNKNSRKHWRVCIKIVSLSSLGGKTVPTEMKHEADGLRNELTFDDGLTESILILLNIFIRTA